MGASVHIVRAVAGPGGDPEGELERAAETVKKAGVEAETHIVRDDASEALIAAAEEHDPEGPAPRRSGHRTRRDIRG